MTTNQLTDEMLLDACIRQDRNAQFALHKRYYGRLLSICMRYVNRREEAEEVLNDAFCKIFLNASKYRSEGDVGAWMSKITLFTAIDYARKNAKYKKILFTGFVKDEPIENDIFDEMDVQSLMDKVQKLPASSRTIFSLYVIDGYSHKEIANLLGISIGTSKWHLSNARKLLQRAIIK